MSIIPTAKIKSAGFSPNERVLLDCQYRAPGKYCRIYDIEEYGRCISYPSVNGKLIYSSSDTINVNMTHERWMYNIKKSTNQTDSILSTYILGTDIYRWFYNDSKMPLAVYSYQTTVNGIENALAYRADDEYLKKGIQTTEENSEAFRDFYAEYRQGNLKLHIGAIQPITVSIEIVSDNGIPYGMHTQTLTEGSKELNIGVGSLRYGRYVIALKADTQLIKQYINVL